VGLDMSTKTGYAVINDGTLSDYGMILRSPRSLDEETQLNVEDYGFLSDAKDIAIGALGVAQREKPDFIYIEQTNKGRNRVSQNS